MAPNNKTVTVYYRVPKDSDPKRMDLFGGEMFSQLHRGAQKTLSQNL